MRVKNDYVLREIAGEYILVPVSKTNTGFNGLITINEIGFFIWKNIGKYSTIKELVNLILDEYEVDESTAYKDVSEFIDNLKSIGIVE